MTAQAQPSAAGAKLELLYPKPLLIHRWPDAAELNRELARAILERMAREAGGRRSNIGGWQSDYTFADWPDAAARTLVERIYALMREMVARTVPNADERHYEGWQVEAWANVNRRGHYNKPHNHTSRGNLWSGFYCVAIEDHDVGGATCFHDESGVPKEVVADANPFAREVVVEPIPGQMVLFPGPLTHYVRSYGGRGDRISVAFNFRHDGFVIPRYDADSFLLRNFRGVLRGREIIGGWARKLLGGSASRDYDAAWKRWYTSDHPLRRNER